MSLWRKAATSSFRALCAPAYRGFLRDCQNPQAAQDRVLGQLLASMEATTYGKSHALKANDSYEQFCAKVPLQTYEHLSEWVEAQALKPRDSILCPGGAEVFERTSGSSGLAKKIPYNKAARKSFENYFRVWAYDLLKHGPAFESFRTYISISASAGQAGERESGLADDADYLSPWLKLLLQPFLAVPLDLKSIRDPELFRLKLCAHLVQASELEILSIWHPSLFLVLLEQIQCERKNLAKLLRSEFRPSRAVLNLLESNQALDPQDLWPQLKLISAWQAGNSALHAQKLRQLFPRAQFQGKGLLSTEAPVSLPLLGHGSFPFLSEVFLEFVSASGEIKRLHEISEGTYRVVVSQAGGFLRYDLGDQVYARPSGLGVPTLEFLGRQGESSDLVGEKLVARNAEDLFLQFAEQGHGSEFCLLPLLEPKPFYGLLHSNPKNSERTLSEKADAFLRRFHHYGYARDLGQLGPVRPIYVENLNSQLLRFYSEVKQMKQGDIKVKQLLKTPSESEALLSFLKIGDA